MANKILWCDKCNNHKPHKFMRVGKIYRENVIFREQSPQNQEIKVPYSGYQTGNTYACYTCGSVRMQGSRDNFRETAKVNQALFESMPENWSALGNTAQIRSRYQKKGKAA